MKFGPIPTALAEGAILAHSAQALGASGAGYKVAKGTVLSADHLRDLRAAGLTELVVAVLEPGDVSEDIAATRLAEALIQGRTGLEARPATKGRVNLRATDPGVVDLNADAIRAANRIDPGITIATVPEYQRMGSGGLVATVKVIPYAVPEGSLAQATQCAMGAMGLRVAVVQCATLIETQVNADVPSDKGRNVIADRLARFDVHLDARKVVDHKGEEIAKALELAKGDLVLILTASATSDLHDTAPEGVRKAGGQVAHYGMPVDPGNLLFLGTLGDKPVIGLPGCARSPALNGADWVLERVICGVPIAPEDIMDMGVGGLLKEIPTRPQPRARSQF